MADDHSQRPYRSSESIARAGQGKAPAAPAGADPLAELARLIGQSDPFGEFSRENARRAAEQAAAPAYAAPQAPEVPAVAAAQDYAEQEYYATSQAPTAPYDAHQEQAYEQAAYGQQGYAADAGYDQYAANGAAAYPATGAYDPNNPPYDAGEQDFYDDVPPSRRRIGVMAIAAVVALAIIGTAGAFGYRAIFGSSGASAPPPVIKAESAPSKVVPATAKDSNKLITDRVAGPQGEKLVSREERPVENPPLTPDNASGNSGPAGASGNDPKKVRTISIRPDQSSGATVADAAPVTASNAPLALVPDQPMRQVQTQRVSVAPQPPDQAPARQVQTRPVAPQAAPQATAPAAAPAAAPSNAPLSLNPNAAPARTASVPSSPPAASGAGAYGVQVTSQRSEAEAEAAYRALVGKYGAQLGGKPHFVYRIDLGAKGTYYRAMIGPFANGSEATEVCSALKAAGGQCIIQRN